MPDKTQTPEQRAAMAIVSRDWMKVAGVLVAIGVAWGTLQMQVNRNREDIVEMRRTDQDIRKAMSSVSQQQAATTAILTGLKQRINRLTDVLIRLERKIDRSRSTP